MMCDDGLAVDWAGETGCVWLGGLGRGHDPNGDKLPITKSCIVSLQIDKSEMCFLF